MTADDSLTVVNTMIELYNDGTPESYGSDRFIELFDPGASSGRSLLAVGRDASGGPSRRRPLTGGRGSSAVEGA